MRHLLLTVLSVWFSLQVHSQESLIYNVGSDLSTGTSVQVNETTDGTSIDVQVGSFETMNFGENAGVRIRMIDGITYMDKGTPDIQYLSVSIAIPNTGKTQPVINTAEYTDYSSFEVAPTSGDPGLFPNTAQVSYNNNIYSANSFFPQEIVKANDPYIFAGTRGQVLYISPVQYNPVTKVLRVYTHINVTLTTTSEPGVNELVSFSPAAGILDVISSSNFLNSKGKENRYMAVEEQGNMLVIAHPAFIESMKPFVEWKNQKGISCEIVDVTTIGNADQIKKYVSDYYYNKGLTYLLLAGDDKYVPTNTAEKGASDNMYAYLSGDDHYPEILVGRFPCETAAQCDIMVKRTVEYEKNPAGGESYNNFLGIGSASGPGDDNEFDYQHIQNIASVLKNNVFSGITEMYDGSRGGADKDGNPTASMVTNAINDGQGCIMYIGHGSVNSWLTSGYSVSDVKKLTNTTHPFIWSAGCDNGGFVGTTSFAEFLMRAENEGKPTGAIATLMSSANQSWFPPMEAQDEITQIISGQKSNNQSSTFGGISISGCMRMNDKYGNSGFTVTDNWILFGDPSVELRTNIAKEIRAEHQTVIGDDATDLTISGLDSNMMVAISVNGKLIAVSRTQNGTTSVSLPSLKGIERLLVTITGKNYKAYNQEIEVTSSPAIAINPFPANHNNKIKTTTNFNWNLKPGVAPRSFVFCIRPAGSANWNMYTTNSAQELSIPELEHLTTYEWKVISNTDASNAESNVFTFTTIDRPDEDFEQEGFPRNNWVNSQEWYVDNSESFEGSFSLHSGSTVSREYSSLFYECETTTCDYISFEVKVNAISQGAKLGFYLDNFLVAEWNYTIGWTNMYYEVEPGTHTFEWRFVGGDSINNQSAAWLDNIYLPINAAVVFGKTSQQTCAVQSIELEATVENHASLLWNTSGTGYFDDPERIDATYFPSEQDLLSDKIELSISVNSNNICANETYAYEIMITELPELPTISDTTLYAGESFTITGSELYERMYTYYGSDTTESSIELDASKLVAGENTITVVGENTMGCTVTKQFSINVIPTARPTAALTVYPNPSADQITIINPDAGMSGVISIYSMDGQLIEQHNTEGFSTNTLKVSHLNPGMYIVRSENNGKAITGKFVKI